MNNDKKILGKGLSALISESTISFVNSQNNAQAVSVLSIRSILCNENQPRKFFDQQKLEELSISIKEYGVLQPIIVKKVDNEYYKIIAGERRYHAAKMAGLKEIPVIVKTLNEISSYEIALIENIQRENLGVLEEAKAYTKLIDEYGHTHETIGEKVGKSRSYISNTMRLLKLPIEVQKLIESNQITSGHARAIIGSDNPIEVAKQVLKQNLSVRETEKLINRIRASLAEKGENTMGGNSYADKSEGIVERNDDISFIERNLGNILQAKVKIKTNGEKATVIIRCHDIISFDEIIAKLSDEGMKL